MSKPLTQTSTPIRIAIADDHSIFRKGLTAMLKGDPHLQIIGEATNGQELIEIVKEKRPDVVLTDIQMPIMDGIEATKEIKKCYSATNIIAISMFDQESIVLALMRAGAKGFLLKNTTKEEMVDAVQIVNSNGTYYCSTASNKMVNLMTRTDFHPYEQSKRTQFSKQDIQIIRQICQEQSSKEIAATLKLSDRTVEGVRDRIQKKIGARNVVGIVVYAIRYGIFNLD